MLVSISEIACLVLCIYSIRVELDGRSTNLVLNDHLIPSTLAVSVFPIKKKHTNSLEFPPPNPFSATEPFLSREPGFSNGPACFGGSRQSQENRWLAVYLKRPGEEAHGCCLCRDQVIIRAVGLFGISEWDCEISCTHVWSNIMSFFTGGSHVF